MIYSIASTFTSFPDGSGAQALATLRGGAIVRFDFSTKCATVCTPVEGKSQNRHALGYGRARGMAESEIKKLRVDFDARVAALGAEWLAANRAMYADLLAAAP